MSSGSERSRAFIRLGDKSWEVRGWPTRPFAATKVYSEGQSKFAINAKGQLFSNLVRPGRSIYPGLRHGNSLSIMKGLKALGVVKDKGALAQLIEAEEQRRARESLAYDAEQFLYHAKKLRGLVLYPAQKAFLKKLIRAAKR